MMEFVFEQVQLNEKVISGSFEGKHISESYLGCFCLDHIMQRGDNSERDATRFLPAKQRARLTKLRGEMTATRRTAR